jgi:hypothetical protein
LSELTHAKVSCGRESLHTATVTRSGRERSRISAAVSLSMTIIGAPHFGQSHRSLEPLLPDMFALSATLNRADENKVAGAWRDADWRGIRSSECARSLWGVGARGSGAGTHRQIESSTSVRYGERNRASER